MIPWSHLASAAVPGGGELRLMQRGAEFSIMLGGNELMNSRLRGSEEALAAMTAERIAGRPASRVLIGGLGMGFTLRAALASFGPGAVITVAELVPGVVDWARGPMVHLFGGSLDDPRTTIEISDVGRLIEAGERAYDAILLDVDNGPDGLTRAANDRLYAVEGLGAARRALRPGGVLAVWSSGPDRGFEARLRAAGLSVETVPMRATGKRRGSRHVLWFATKPG